MLRGLLGRRRPLATLPPAPAVFSAVGRRRSNEDRVAVAAHAPSAAAVFVVLGSWLPLPPTLSTGTCTHTNTHTLSLSLSSTHNT
jgi:hypothetical protein